MAAAIGRVDPFEDGDDWASYYDRLLMFFIANDIPTEKHVPALLSLMGTRCYALLKGLTAPDNPSSKTFKQLTDMLEAHFTPKPLVCHVLKNGLTFPLRSFVEPKTFCDDQRLWSDVGLQHIG